LQTKILTQAPHAGQSRDANLGHTTNLEPACKMKHCVQDQIKDAETSRARESKRKRNKASHVEILPSCRERLHVLGGLGQKHFRDSVKASLSGQRPMGILEY